MTGVSMLTVPLPRRRPDFESSPAWKYMKSGRSTLDGLNPTATPSDPAKVVNVPHSWTTSELGGGAAAGGAGCCASAAATTANVAAATTARHPVNSVFMIGPLGEWKQTLRHPKRPREEPIVV